MKSEPGPSPGPAFDKRSVRSAPAGAPGPRSVSMREGSVKSHHSDPVPAEPTGTHHHHDSPSARAMSEDSSRISMHSRARTPPRYGGTISSSSNSVKSEPPSVKQSPSVKSEEPNPRSISLPGSSVGSRTSYGGQSRGLDRRSDFGRHMGGPSRSRDRQPRVWLVVTTGQIGVLWVLVVARRQARNQRYQGERHMGVRQAPLWRSRLGRRVVDLLVTSPRSRRPEPFPWMPIMKPTPIARGMKPGDHSGTTSYAPGGRLNSRRE